jgi:uncharacterized 2Fe-2S/4Fe-4S cluster protein (DUF4445 family)
MATEPQFVTTPKTAWATLTAVNATASINHDGTGTIGSEIFEIFEAGASGGYVESVKALSLGTNTASVLRVFLNNGSTNGTAANNSLIAEAALPETAISEVAALAEVEVLLGINLPAGYKLLVCLGTAVATGWAVTALGADY